MEAQSENPTEEIERLRRRVDDLGSRLAQRTAELAAADEALKQETAGRRRAEAALGLRELDFQLIVDSIPVPVAVTTPSGEVEGLNRLTLEYFGKTLEELKGWTASDVVHPDDLQRTLDAQLAAHQRGDAYHVESRHRRADGIYRWFDVRGFPLRGAQGRILRWFHLLIDIDDWKRVEQALRQSEAFLAEGQRLSSTGSFSWRVDSDEIAFSGELRRIFGFDQDAPVTFELIASRVHPEDVPLLAEKIEQARAGGSGLEYEIRLQMPEGSVRYLRTIAHGTRHPDGRLEYVGAIQDVTQRRLADEALAETRSELAHVARITSLGVLTASIAHEVKQPLAAIITNGETSLRWLDRAEPDVAEVRKLTERVINDALRASEIINRIRDMATRRAPEQTLVSLDDVVKELMVFLREELQSRKVAVAIELAAALPQVVGDRTQLQQVVVNLAINAAQAMAQAGAARRSILIRTMLADAETVCCTVEDSGPGIDPQNIPRLFDAFFTTKDSMGMGLPISRSIIEALGGRISADNDSALGGARFSVALPGHLSAQPAHR